MAHVGRLVNLGIAKEGTRGEGTAAEYWMPRTSFSVNSVTDTIMDTEGYNDIRNNVSAYVVKERAEGDLEATMRANALGLLLYNVFGAVSSTTASGESDVYDHTFTCDEDSNEHQSLALTIDDPVQDYMYKLAMLESLSISATTGEFVTISASFRAKAGDETTATPDYETDATADRYVMHSRHVDVKFANSTSGLGAASKQEIKSLEINFNKNVIDDDSIHSVEPVDIFNRQFSVDGTIELKYDSSDIRDYVLDNTAKAMRIEIKNSEKPLGTTPTYPGLKLDMPKVQFDEWERTDDLDEIIDQSVTFVPMTNPRTGAGYFSDVVLTNNQASY